MFTFKHPNIVGFMTIKNRLIDQEIQQLSKEIGEKIRQEQKLAGLTLVDAAQALGIAKQTLSDLETAKKTCWIDDRPDGLSSAWHHTITNPNRASETSSKVSCASPINQ